MSAAVASGKLARSAPKAEYSIVLSSETRKAATLATQNTGQGDAGWACVSRATAGSVARVTGLLRGGGVVGSGVLRQVARRRCRQALLDVPGALVGQHLVEAGFEPVEGALDDVFRACLRAVDRTHEVGVDKGHVQRQHLRLLRRQLVAKRVGQR